jgi:hypothetical protein
VLARAQSFPHSKVRYPHRSSVEAAQREFYNARYESAARMTLEACAAELSALAACELRTAALLFQIRALLATHSDKDEAWKRCATCPDLLSAFKVALAHGQTAARARLLEHPTDDETLFLLGKLDLNYVWLQLGTLGHKTGWDEYWEARKSLDTVLERQPAHVRARVARGWIDYIVATKMPRGTRWLLGGGSRKEGLQAIREAAGAEADFFTRTEARFALWDMQVREARHTRCDHHRGSPHTGLSGQQELSGSSGFIAPPVAAESARQHTPTLPRELTSLDGVIQSCLHT